MSIQDDFRKAQGKADAAVDKYGDAADAKIRPFLTKYGVWIAVGIAAIGGLLLLVRGF